MVRWVFPLTMIFPGEEHFHVKVISVPHREVEHPVARVFYLIAFSPRLLILMLPTRLAAQAT
jgi:hypothetical protein